MTRMVYGVHQGLTADLVEPLRLAALDTGYVSLGSRRTASPHEFYRYPARFSPVFARTAIEAFTQPGDLVLDPFVGGGTTLVEARLAGRLALGSDLNPLAVLVSQVKAQPRSRSDLEAVFEWVSRLPGILAARSVPPEDGWTGSNYFRNIDTPELEGIRTALIRARHSLQWLPTPASESFARCILLRAGQWALDMRIETPSTSDFEKKLVGMAEAMVVAGHEYRRAVRMADGTYDALGYRRTTVLRQALPGLADRIGVRLPVPKLILTSPPYPGVYVNYHRWKVLGRRETPAPFWLANELDGKGMSHYTMSARSDPTLDTYYSHLELAFGDLSRIADGRTVVVQMVGFHDPAKDLPRYLAAMERAGFEELSVPGLEQGVDGRLWREVPNRRWWVQDGSKGTHTAREVVLVHKKRPRSRLFRE